MRLVPIKRNEASERDATDAFGKPDSELKSRMYATVFVVAAQRPRFF